MGNNYCDFSGYKNPNYKTGLTVKGKRSSLYNTWCCIKQRCLNPNSPKYPRYGGRGIKISPAWLSIKEFYNWAMLSGWKQGLTLDRINNDGNYCPENCRWVSVSQNSKKKSTTKLSDENANLIRNKFKSGFSISELAREFNVSYGTIWFIVKNITHKF